MNFRISDFAHAAAGFQSIIDHVPGGDRVHVEALFGLASTLEWQRPGPNLDRARELYQKIITDYPQSEFVPWSALDLARMKANPDYNVESDRVKGVPAYQEVIDKYPGTMAADEALILQQTLRTASYDPTEMKDVITVLTRFVMAKPNSHFAATAWYIIGTTALHMKDHLLARNSYVSCYDVDIAQKATVMRGFRTFDDECSLLYAIGALSEFKLGDFATARKYYNQLLTDFPKDWRAFTVQQAIERMARIEAGGTLDVPGVIDPSRRGS